MSTVVVNGATVERGADARERAVRGFRQRFGAQPTHVTRAPGRVNIIGDHTDYNDGFVLPMALERAVWIAWRRSERAGVAVHSLDVNDSATFDLHDFGTPDIGWIEYIRGVAWALRNAGHDVSRGWEGVLASDVPVGAGLSSSAAVELAAARTFAAVNDLTWDPSAMARLAQHAENHWVGMNCGIMDQMISAAGTAGHALLIDCRSLVTTAVPIPSGVSVVVLDTGTRRGLVDSAYNERRAQCEGAAAFFGVAALRDVDRSMFDARESGLPPLMRQRARHVISENARTLAAAEALTRGRVADVGRLMDESHISLRDDFEVSRPELDAMVRAARTLPGCHGARMTGAGFGGCAVALVESDLAAAFATDVRTRYRDDVGLDASIYVSRAAGGAELEAVESMR
ncbi:MAG: galactokinase [Gemmatimonadaceae bacterium]